MSDNKSFSWEALLSSAARLQKILPEAILVGGTAAALYAHHRVSLDADHVAPDLWETIENVCIQASQMLANELEKPFLIT
jgi:hypothetical protein